MMLLKTAVTSLLEVAEDRVLYVLRISDMRPGIVYEGYIECMIGRQFVAGRSRCAALLRIEGVVAADDRIVRRRDYIAL
jgi:hypothetical protein